MAEKLAKDLYLHNALKHININKGHDFCALFVVNTPVTDNSGIAHCVEHLVFRASEAFPEATTLFQLTALANVKINASTLANTTYFHCQSPCLESFNLAFNYLLNGIFNPLFHQEDLNKEIHDGSDHGVIYRELIGIKSQIEHEHQHQKKQSADSKKNKAYSYSGESHLIGKLSLSDLQNFHQQHYQARNITLVTSNADIEQVSTLISQLPTQPKHLQKIIPLDNTDKCSDDNAQQKKYSPEINQLITVYDQYLQDFNNQKPDNDNSEYHDYSKYSKVKKSASFIVEQTALKHAALKKTALKQTDKLNLSTQRGLTPPLIILSNILEKQFIDDKYINNQYIKNKLTITPLKQTLPPLFNALYLKAKMRLNTPSYSNKSNKKQLDKNLVYIYDQHNALLLASINKAAQQSVHIASYIISAYPSFLAARCQGLCYAIQAVSIEDSSYLAIYSAFDCTPKIRQQTMIQSLLQLSQDISFIQKSLPLAKMKYCQVHSIEIHKLNYITPLDISVSLLTLTSTYSNQ
ncbi:MAG: insulinase family protein [Colwellia sp.]|nr:insulinase family protein [Colwellia sp.]